MFVTSNDSNLIASYSHHYQLSGCQSLLVDILQSDLGLSVVVLSNACGETEMVRDSGFRRGVNEVCTLLGFSAAYVGSSAPMLRDNLSVPSSRVK
jgi:hypothetical protein